MDATIGVVPLSWQEGANIIVGQSHFIKTVEDLAEIVSATVPGAKYGLAFCEASGPCLVRTEGNDPALVADAVQCAQAVA
ncbi:MAG: adenosine-specific kinase, partial [Spirochaetia bacterium]